MAKEPNTTPLVDLMDDKLKSDMINLAAKYRGLHGEISTKITAYERGLLTPVSDEYVPGLKHLLKQFEQSLASIENMFNAVIDSPPSIAKDVVAKEGRLKVLAKEIKKKLKYFNKRHGPF